MKDELCRAFCNDLQVRDVPAGLAVSTGFNTPDGEPLGFYVVGPDAGGLYRIEDDGATIPHIEACGADLETQTRSEALRSLLDEYDCIFDEDRGELTTDLLPKSELPKAAMRFVALLLRIHDLALLTQEKVASTFMEDALRQIKATLSERVTIQEEEAVDPRLAEFPADVVLRATDRNPVAVMFGLTEQRVYEAILLQMAALYEARVPCSVIALLESGGSISQKLRQKADNRLAAVPIYRGDEQAAIARIVREVMGDAPQMH